jgi:hypothetical protein
VIMYNRRLKPLLELQRKQDNKGHSGLILIMVFVHNLNPGLHSCLFVLCVACIIFFTIIVVAISCLKKKNVFQSPDL